MNLVASILAVKHITGTSAKTQKPYSFNSMSVIDTHSDEPEIIKVNVDDERLPVVSALVGKVGTISVQYARGNFTFVGIPK